MNVSNASNEKEFVLLFLRSGYGKYVKIVMETLIKVYLVLEFSLPSEF